MVYTGTRMGQGGRCTCRARHYGECHLIPEFLQSKDGRRLRMNANTWFRLEEPAFDSHSLVNGPVREEVQP